jgi:HPt (histidine-containing phosphotransfer) domain-containing protein
MRELIAEFAASMRDRSAALRSALDGRDLTNLTRQAHQLKGAAGGYGFDPLGRAAGALETGLRAAGPEASLESFRQQVEELIALCGRVRA